MTRLAVHSQLHNISIQAERPDCKIIAVQIAHFGDIDGTLYHCPHNLRIFVPVYADQFDAIDPNGEFRAVGQPITSFQKLL